MSEQPKRGRRRTSNPRQKRNLYLTQTEIDELTRCRGDIPEAIAIRQLFLIGLHGDSGLQERGEAAEKAAD